MNRAFIAGDVFGNLDPGDTARTGAADHVLCGGDPRCGRLEQLPGLRCVAQLVALFTIEPEPPIERVQTCAHAIAALRRGHHLGIAFERNTSDASEGVSNDLALETTLAVVGDVGEYVAAASAVAGRGSTIR